jgi:hypothetical protein
LLPLSLRSLFKTIDEDVPVIVIDGGAPEHIRKELFALCAERPFEVVECDDFILPNKARNIALDRVQTKYVVFCDNELAYWSGWLDALIENAETNGSVAVAPLTLIGPSDPLIVHHAGGSFVLRNEVDRRVLIELHHYDTVPLSEAKVDRFVKAPLDHMNFEYHCVLLDVEAMRAIGGHDERLTVREHIDSSLRLLIAGGRLTFEPSAWVMCQTYARFEDEDWPYFLFRWDQRRVEISEDVFAENWGVYNSLDASRWLRWYRDSAMFTRLPRLPKPLDRFKLKRALLKLYRTRILSLGTKQLDDKISLVLPKPPSNGLEKAGIKWTNVPPVTQPR